jgi:light-regulated signal transduction histidine kinase (bacteriophytochrome)
VEQGKKEDLILAWVLGSTGLGLFSLAWISRNRQDQAQAELACPANVGSSLDTTPQASAQLRADLEARVEERTRQLLEANRELDNFARTVSHDLRAPLRHIEGFAALLAQHLEARPGALDDKGRHYLNRITGATQAMGSLIEDLLAYSRLARQEMHSTTVDLDRMLTSLREEFPSSAAWELGVLGKVCGDPSQLRQAFRNLLDNAVKFSAPRSDPRIWVRRAGMRTGRTIFEVGDNGVGFDPAYADKIFGVFQRLHSAADFEGTGIGLAIVARVIQHHQSEVWVESQPGEGARFFLTLEAGKEES